VARADYAAGLRTAGAQSFDQREEAGGALIRAQGPDSLLVIVPAWNEEGAIGDVVRSVRAHVPGAPVLVVDDHSVDSTIATARAAVGASPRVRRVCSGRIQARLRAGVPVRDLTGRRRPARRPRYSTGLREAEGIRLRDGDRVAVHERQTGAWQRRAGARNSFF